LADVTLHVRTTPESEQDGYGDRVRGHLRGDDGASAVEYGLLVAGIAAIIAIVVFTLGGFIKSALYDHTCNAIKDGAHMSNASCG
jgi:pilus assembly protein Flp/PilA